QIGLEASEHLGEGRIDEDVHDKERYRDRRDDDYRIAHRAAYVVAELLLEREEFIQAKKYLVEAPSELADADHVHHEGREHPGMRAHPERKLLAGLELLAYLAYDAVELWVL